MGHLMERQLDPAAGLLLQKRTPRHRNPLPRADDGDFFGHKRAEAVLLDDGTIYPADLVVMATGIRRDARRHRYGAPCGARHRCRRSTVGRPIGGRRSAEHAGACYGLVEPIWTSFRLGGEDAARGGASFWVGSNGTHLKVTGVNVSGAGDFLGAAGTESVTLSDRGLILYKKLVIADSAA